MKEQKGITLVALIITIIVMLILVAVTVAVVVNSNLIGSAEKAANGYKNADDKLKTIGTDNIIENAAHNSIQDYVNEYEKSKAST